MDDRAPRVGHKKSRKGCAQCKRRHVKCNEEAPCSNCVRHKVPCSLAGGPYVPREDAKNRRTSTTSSIASMARTSSHETSMTDTSMAGSSTPAAAAESRHISPQPSPFSALTGLIERPTSNDPRSWIQDLELMHYYTMNTSDVLADPKASQYILHIWRVELPKVAFAHDYLMHAVLGLTALHQAQVEPQGVKQLRECAVDHLDKALVSYRSSDPQATAGNANAKFLFTWMVVLFGYAIPPSLPSIDAMAELFMLVKGVDSVLSETWFWVSQGPFAPILTRGFQQTIASSAEAADKFPDGMELGLGHLEFMLSVDISMSPADRNTCTSVLAELSHIYENMQHGQTAPSVAMILCFPKQDSAAFAKLLKNRSRQALIILAHYCVLLDVLRSRWWVQGWSRRVMQDILSTLDDQWRHWIQWPVQAVLQRRSSPPTAVQLNPSSFLRQVHDE